MPRADLMSMKKCEDERIYYRNGVLLKNLSRRIEAGSVVDRLNEHLVQDDDVPSSTVDRTPRLPDGA